MEQRGNQINTNRGKIMKNTLIGVAILTLVSLPTSAGMLGMDWEATGEYNVDTEVSTLKAEVGKTISLGGFVITLMQTLILSVLHFLVLTTKQRCPFQAHLV